MQLRGGTNSTTPIAVQIAVKGTVFLSKGHGNGTANRKKT
jgi:hypothetical protein